jgi:glycine oxidase
MEIIVLGGGAIGLAVALELAARGADVTLLERGAIGQGTSWAAAGILPAAQSDRVRIAGQRDPLDALRSHSHELYPQWTQRIVEQSGIDVGFRRCGGLYLASTAGEAAALIAGLEYWHSDGIAAQRLSAAELARQEPALASWAHSPRFRAAVWIEDERQVRPPDLLRGLAVAGAAAGVRIHEHVDVRLERRGDQAVLRTDDESLAQIVSRQPTIVLCGGVWGGQAAAEFGLGMSVVPIRGQMLLYRLDTPRFRPVINEGHRYLVPRDDGHVLVGSCEEEVGFTPGTTSEMLATLAQWAGGVVPELQSLEPVKSWSGLRPGTFDGFPIIGRVPEIDNLLVAGGHYRSGIHLAPATAEVIADLIEQHAPIVDPAAFAVGRMFLTPTTI